MSQGFLSAMIHRWAPNAEIKKIDTVFRAPCLVDSTYKINGVVSGGNAFKYGEAGYYSMLSTGSNVSKDDHKNKDYLAVVKASQWMKEEPREPFLLFLPGRGAHPPYGSPAEFNEKWSVDEVRDKITLRPPYGEGKPKYHSKDAGVPHYRNLTALPPTEQLLCAQHQGLLPDWRALLLVWLVAYDAALTASSPKI